MNLRDLIFPRGATKHDWVLDGMLALAMFLVTVLPYASYSAWNGTPRALLLVTLSLMVLPLVVRRHSPLLMLAGCTVAGIAQVAVVNTFTATLVVLPIVAYSVARWVPGPLARSVVVAAPADTSPLMRLQGAAYATTVAEHFRDQGRQVLLIMDSLTRYAMAQREIALAIGEPPVTRGYPPSVFARLPQLVERAGNGPDGGGSITAFYTVLAEGDDQQDPIADSARAILDGHFVLTRALAEAGHYPAIDIEQSISRAMHGLVKPTHFELVRRFKQLYSRYQRSRDLIAVGAYAPGGDPLLDKAVAMYPQFEAFLQQKMNECDNYEDSVVKLHRLFDQAL